MPYGKLSKKNYFIFFRYSHVTAENRHEYVQLAKQFRLHEFDLASAAVREGMARVIPVPLLSLFTGFELETMVCGSPDIPLHLLKSVATYKGNTYIDNSVKESWPPKSVKKSIKKSVKNLSKKSV